MGVSQGVRKAQGSGPGRRGGPGGCLARVHLRGRRSKRAEGCDLREGGAWRTEGLGA